jgi:hypothetical protein
VGGVTITNPPTTVKTYPSGWSIAVADKGWEKNIVALKAVADIGNTLAMAYLRASNVAGNNIAVATGNKISIAQKTAIINERAGFVDVTSTRPRAPDVWAMRVLWLDSAGNAQECYVGLPHPDTN